MSSRFTGLQKFTPLLAELFFNTLYVGGNMDMGRVGLFTW